MFENFKSVMAGDRFYLRAGGSASSAAVEERRSGWLCLSEDQRNLVVTPSIAPPPTALVWQARSVTGLRVTAASNGLGLTFARNAEPSQLVGLANGESTWTLAGFQGYSDNSVPGFGYEANAFLLRDPFGQDLGFDAEGRLCYNSEDAAGFNLLYVSGPRDTIATVVFRVSNVFQGQTRYLALGSPAGPTAQNVSWTSDAKRATLCQVRGATEQKDPEKVRMEEGEFRFLIGIAASEWILGSDVNRALIWGLPSEKVTLTPLFASVPGVLQLDVASDWTVQVGIVHMKIGSNLVLQQNLERGLEFVLRAAPEARLLLSWSKLLQARVAILQPLALRNEARVAGTQSSEALPSPPRKIVGQRGQPGCRVLEDQTLEARWFPELQGTFLSMTTESTTVITWVSGNAPDNVLFLSAQPGLQSVRRSVSLHPMAQDSVCVVDETGSVPPLCGALVLQFVQADLNAFTVVAPSPPYLQSATCEQLYGQNLISPDSEGYAWIFPNETCSGGTFIRLASTESSLNNQMNVAAVIVPENLRLNLVLQSVKLVVTPGQYNRKSLNALDSRVPLQGTLSFSAYCSTLSPRAVFVANACNGSSASRSLVWKEGEPDCNAFFDAACTTVLKNAAICGCYADIEEIMSYGLGATGATMVTRPQCWGRVCSLGTAYRKNTWKQPCGAICQQLILGSGRDWLLAGKATIACNGSIYNTTSSAAAAAQPQDNNAWFIAMCIAIATTIAAVILFALAYTRKI